MKNLLDNTPDQSSKFRQKNWVESITNGSRGKYNTNSQIKFKTSALKSSSCDYGNACILVSGAITIIGRGAEQAAVQADERYKRVIFKNCAPFSDRISKINNAQVDDTKNLHVVMLIYNQAWIQRL